MASYYHRRWECPFYAWDEKLAVHCEGGVIRLPDKQAMTDYIGRYCCGDWRRCHIARTVSAYYERKEDDT